MAPSIPETTARVAAPTFSGRESKSLVQQLTTFPFPASSSSEACNVYTTGANGFALGGARARASIRHANRFEASNRGSLRPRQCGASCLSHRVGRDTRLSQGRRAGTPRFTTKRRSRAISRRTRREMLTRIHQCRIESLAFEELHPCKHSLE